MRLPSWIWVGLIVFLGCSPQQSQERHFRVANGAETSSLDPHKVTGAPGQRVLDLFFEGLVRYDARAKDIEPALAHKWDVSQDGLTYIFYLRKAHFSDGVQIKAQDVEESWRRLLRPETGSPYSQLAASVLEGALEYQNDSSQRDVFKVKALDDQRLRVQFKTLALPALAHFTFSVLPMHVIRDKKNAWTERENFVTSGPFVLEKWELNQQLTALANGHYWNKPNLDKVTFYPVNTPSTVYNMFVNNEVDWVTLSAASFEHYEAFCDDPRLQTHPFLSTYFLMLNPSKKPLDDPKVRHALSSAIEREILTTKVTKMGELPATGLIQPMKKYKEKKYRKPDFEEARRQLSLGGYPEGEGFPSLNFLYNTSSRQQKVAEFVQDQWKTNLGIDVMLTNVEWGAYLGRIATKDYDIVRGAWPAEYEDPILFFNLFLSTDPLSNYKNKDYDEKIWAASSMKPGKARSELLQSAETMLLDRDQIIIPLYFYTSINLIDTKKWGGWAKNTLDVHPLVHVFRKEK